MSEIVAYARSLVGKARWRHRGRKPWAVDCAGVVVLSVRAGGKQIQDVRGYGREPWNDLLRTSLRAQFGNPIEETMPGDIAVIQTGAISDPYHAGIIGDHPDGGLSVIHAHPIHGVIEQSLLAVTLIEAYRPV